jgi:hypothetical protein
LGAKQRELMIRCFISHENHARFAQEKKNALHTFMAQFAIKTLFLAESNDDEM